MGFYDFMTTFGSGLITRQHSFTRPVAKLLVAFVAETSLHPKNAVSEFADWLHNQPKLTANTKERYRRHAAKLLGVDIPNFANTIDAVTSSTHLNVDTYTATIAKLKRISQTNENAAHAKQVAMVLFVCTAITGYSLADILTASSLSTPESEAEGLWSCELTLHPARHNKPTEPIVRHYSGLNDHEVAQMTALITIAAAYPQHLEFFRKLHKKAFYYISHANPAKNCSLWDMRRIYPKVLGYLQDA